MIAAIENAICDRLQSATSLLGYDLQTVARYDNRFDGQDDLASALADLPGAWVVWLGDSSPQQMGQASWKTQSRFEVLVAAYNDQSLSSARHGEPGQVGSYQIAQDIQTLLVGQTLGLAIDPLELVSSKPMTAATTSNGYLSVLALEFATASFITALPDGLAASLVITDQADGQEPPPSKEETLAKVFAVNAGLGDLATFGGAWNLPVTDLIELENGA